MDRAAIAVEGLEQALRTARQVRNLGEDTTPLLEIAGGIMEASILRRFQTKRGPEGVPWPPSRRGARSVVGEAGPSRHSTLVNTGDLRDSIRYVVRKGEVEAGSDGLKNPMKALANQFGSHILVTVSRHTRVINSAFGVPLPRPVSQNVRAHLRINNLPARPFVGVDAEDRRDIIEEWREHLKGLFHV